MYFRVLAMNKLHLALQDGFRDDSVRVSVNGHVVSEKTGVTTNLAISYADAVEVAVPDATVVVEVSVLSRNRAAKETINVTKEPYLYVNLADDGTPVFRRS